MTSTSIRIMKDYFSIGTGFRTYASAEAEKHYSPVYLKYGFNNNLQLRDINDLENTRRLIETMGEKYNAPKYLNSIFLNDTFWPIIFGQTGFLGTIAYVTALATVLVRCLKVKNCDLYAYVGVLYAAVYLVISSMAEPAFNNSIAIGLALVIGMVFYKQEQEAGREAAAATK